MHADQLLVTVAQVERLVAEQFPAWSGLPVQAVAFAGTVNTLFRLGDALVARFPLVPGDAAVVRAQLVREADAAAELRGRITAPTPVPVALGEPGHGYPLPWSVQTWLSGVDAFVDDPGDSVAFTHDLANLISELRAIDTAGRAFTGGNRGGRLTDHDAWVEICLARSGDLFDVSRLRGLWAEWRTLSRTAPDVMSHGDLIPGNLLVRGGRLAGVLDVGSFGPADPALDLVCAWHLLAAGPRSAFRDELACDDVEWERGRAWAFEQAIGAGWYYRQSNRAMSRMAERTVARLLDADA